MLAPFGEAEPAEVVLAVRAIHVVATLVLLDVGLAFRAGLGVGSEPSEVFRILFFLL